MTNTVSFKDNSFVNIVDLLKDLLEECTFTFTKQSIDINTTDKSLNSFIKIHLDDVYSKCTLKQNKVVTLNLEELQKVFKCKEKDEKMKIQFSLDTINIIFYNELNESQSKYKIKLLITDTDEEMPEIEVEKNTQIVMASKYFTSLCKKIKQFDESLLIECSEDKNEMYLKSGTEDSVELRIQEEKGKLNKLTIEEDVRIMVLLRFVMSFCKGEKFAEQVQINIEDEESPLEIIYSFNENRSFIKFYTSVQEIED